MKRITRRLAALMLPFNYGACTQNTNKTLVTWVQLQDSKNHNGSALTVQESELVNK